MGVWLWHCGFRQLREGTSPWLLSQGWSPKRTESTDPGTPNSAPQKGAGLAQGPHWRSRPGLGFMGPSWTR